MRETVEEMAARIKVLEAENSALSNEVDRLRAELDKVSDLAAAEHRMLLAGVSQEDIDKVKKGAR